MSFTADEKQKWLNDKRAKEIKEAPPAMTHAPRYTCVVCMNDFAVSEGTVTSETAICDTCNY